MAAFSLRGIAAPGLNILVAWSPAKENKNFNALSGTSVACSHVTGIAVLVKDSKVHIHRGLLQQSNQQY
ncbi:hypothetical protein GUJ93_ZPchr0428g29135 [Zizania palustris]|uniref:Peptidase S8/S53 domain-containing protein n=1 Tax=Zizania palustris TaxID=103762 RepID=A0A8J5R0Z1_ZIZPA|nr:hypothetical protein GUJ93_ZPchr0428g29135 [Zizania palustris]